MYAWRMLSRVETAFGFRSTSLILFGCIEILFGINRASNEDFQASRWNPIYGVVPEWVMVTGWTVAGVLALVYGLARIREDSLAWAALRVLPLFQVMTLIFAGLLAPIDWVTDRLGLFPHLPDGNLNGFQLGALFLLLDLLIVQCAHFPDQVPLPDPPVCNPAEGEKGGPNE